MTPAAIRQEAFLLKTGEGNPAAKALLEFLKSPQPLVIIEKYGLGLPRSKAGLTQAQSDVRKAG